MKYIMMFLLVSAVGYGAYFYLILKPISRQAQADIAVTQKPPGSNSLFDAIVPDVEAIKSAKSGGDEPTGAASGNSAHDSGRPMSVASYQGMGFPTVSNFIIPPKTQGKGLLTIDNSYYANDLLLEFRQDDKVIAAALVKKGDRFAAPALPDGRVSLVIQDVSNSQQITTRSFETSEEVKVTPYFQGQIISYRAESQLRR